MSFAIKIKDNTMALTDDKIHKLVDGKTAQIEDKIKDHIDSLVKITTLMFTEEEQRTRESIKRLTERVILQNGSINSIKQWIAKHDGEEEGELRENTRIEKQKQERRMEIQKKAQVVGVIATAIGMIITAIFTILNHGVGSETKQRVENLGEPVVIDKSGKILDKRSVEIKMYPKDFISNDSIK